LYGGGNPVIDDTVGAKRVAVDLTAIRSNQIHNAARFTASPIRHLTLELLMAAGNPTEVLGQLAAEGGYDLLVVGSRGAGLSKAVLGSVPPRSPPGPRSRCWSVAQASLTG
jgi:nucleotide-binding universal stress UspA family protein